MAGEGSQGSPLTLVEVKFSQSASLETWIGADCQGGENHIKETKLHVHVHQGLSAALLY